MFDCLPGGESVAPVALVQLQIQAAGLQRRVNTILRQLHRWQPLQHSPRFVAGGSAIDQFDGDRLVARWRLTSEPASWQIRWQSPGQMVDLQHGRIVNERGRTLGRLTPGDISPVDPATGLDPLVANDAWLRLQSVMPSGCGAFCRRA